MSLYRVSDRERKIERGRGRKRERDIYRESEREGKIERERERQ